MSLIQTPIPIEADGSINPHHLRQLDWLINDAIDEYSIATYKDDEQRTHLGISEIGHQCSRKIFYNFRWMAKQTYDGRMYRLFKRGHREEERFVNILRGIGFQVFRYASQLWYCEPLNDYKVLEHNADLSGGTGSYEKVDSSHHIEEAAKRGLVVRQFRCTGVMGHYGGSCDGVGIHSEWLPNYPFLLEFKTHNTKSFSKYVAEGLHKSKPQHYDQMCGYGWKMNVRYGIYFPENKNDDDIKPTFVELDHKHGAMLEKKAEDIIKSKTPPERVSDNPSYYLCKGFNCEAFKICHEGATPLKNCRSCRHSEPVENAQWQCHKFNNLIPKSFIPDGCNEWVPI